MQHAAAALIDRDPMTETRSLPTIRNLRDNRHIPALLSHELEASTEILPLGSEPSQGACGGDQSRRGEPNRGSLPDRSPDSDDREETTRKDQEATDKEGKETKDLIVVESKIRRYREKPQHRGCKDPGLSSHH